MHCEAKLSERISDADYRRLVYMPHFYVEKKANFILKQILKI